MTKFGNYLLSLRLLRNYKSISFYLADYKLPISEGYYRELETGKSLPSLDMAAALYRVLQADARPFYNYLLEDLLPSHIVSLLAPPLQDKNEDVSYKALTNLACGPEGSTNTCDLNSTAIAFFKKHTNLLAVLMFIYGHNLEGITQYRLEQFLQTESIMMDCSNIVNDFFKLGLIKVWERSDGVKQIAKVCQFLNLNNPDLEYFYLANEFRDEYDKPALKFGISDANEFNSNSQYAFYSLFPVNNDTYDSVITQVRDICEELNFLPANSNNNPLNNDDEVIPLFFWSVVSHSPDWLPD